MSNFEWWAIIVWVCLMALYPLVFIIPGKQKKGNDKEGDRE